MSLYYVCSEKSKTESLLYVFNDPKPALTKGYVFLETLSYSFGTFAFETLHLLENGVPFTYSGFTGKTRKVYGQLFVPPINADELKNYRHLVEVCLKDKRYCSELNLTKFLSRIGKTKILPLLAPKESQSTVETMSIEDIEILLNQSHADNAPSGGVIPYPLDKSSLRPRIPKKSYKRTKFNAAGKHEPPLVFYEITNVLDLFAVSLQTIFQYNRFIQRCEHCGYHFSAYGSRMRYCDNISPEHRKNTCLQQASYKKKRENEAHLLEDRIRLRLLQRKNRETRPHITEQCDKDYESFLEKCIALRAAKKAGEISDGEHLAELQKLDVATKKPPHLRDGL